MSKQILTVLTLALLIYFGTTFYESYTGKSITGFTVSPAYPNFIFILTFVVVFAVFFGLVVFYGLFK